MSERACTKCTVSSKASVWNQDLCPLCGFDNTNWGDAHSSTPIGSTKPSIIATLSTLGWLLFAMMGFSGLFLIFQDGGGIFGVAVIIGGVFQLSIFLGFSAIIDQLYKINVNTSKPDKSDS